MAFWGVEVKPGKPITHSCEKARGRLRITQAALGFGDSAKSSVLQCNVGNRSPVLLCVLLPGKMESSHVELEFEEADDVVFSVIGPRSVYLSGFYVQSRQSNIRSDTESYGMDIENSPADRSNYNSGDDEDGDGYEDSFINDDELQVSMGTPVFQSKGLDEITPEKDEQKDNKGRRKLRKRRELVIESDNDASTPKKEDENGFYLFIHGSDRDVNTACEAGEEFAHVTVQMDDEAKDNGAFGSETKQDIDHLCINDKIERVTQLALDEDGTENDGENETLLKRTLSIIDETDDMQFLDLAKPKKKRKECLLTDETGEVQTYNDPSVSTEHIEHEAAEGLIDLMRVGEYELVMAPELDSSQKSKKRRNEQHEGELVKGTDGVTEHLTAANGEYEQQQKAEETSMDNCGVESHNVQSDDEAMQEVHAENKTDDMPAANGENKERIDSNMCTKPELVSDGNQPGKIKKKKKTLGKEDLNVIASQMSVNRLNEEESTEFVPIDRRTLSNGLTIEELESGPPGGKVAVQGKKIKLFYTGMLKESGKVFDSNVGKSAFKFQLGDKEYIDGWNDGIDGMRVGDKRRLIIPPSMGFGDHQVGDHIPPNSWLIYEIELVRVYH